ncbi:hypothetical protein [Rubrimonas cliftonensis]|uniref:Uncharacterized protein n=1 Tax=Rubrimonas cliftonensis TaxID=89524 RepID=A0A1H4C268_9RHOB|nr:hypothetical protein [Rubrimonas cliftonensis]SEA54417.1 hypothetical protein SAMN05444370_106163 [Rubrimonas cliftonensis]
MLHDMRHAAALLALAACPAFAGEADVLSARIEPSGDGFRVSATVAHADEGWDHYADAFRVVTLEGVELGVRTLFHPHVDEQPFTRSLEGVRVPEGVARVRVEARDSVHGWGGEGVTLDVPR